MTYSKALLMLGVLVVTGPLLLFVLWLIMSFLFWEFIPFSAGLLRFFLLHGLVYSGIFLFVTDKEGVLHD